MRSDGLPVSDGRRDIIMNLRKEDLRLYAVTDRSWLRGRTIYELSEEALRGGVTMLQLREKESDCKTFLREAVRMKELCDKYRVPLIINDNVEIAGAANAAGVHLGQNDMPVSEARAILGPDRIIGVSARTVEQAVLAERQGADFLGAGAVFSTGTKQDAKQIAMSTLQEICTAVSIPVVAIGGITSENLTRLKGSGIAGIAVVSAVFAQEKIEEAVRELRRRMDSII